MRTFITRLLLVGCTGLVGCDGDEKAAPTQDDNASEATAEQPGTEAAAVAENAETDTQDQADTPATTSPEPEAPLTEAPEDLAAAKAELDEERLELAERRAELDAVETELTRQFAEIEALERRLDERLKAGEVARRRRTERIAALADLLMAMAPQSAADMVSRMPDQDARALLASMSVRDPRKTSKLLAAMPGDRAAALGQLYIEHDPSALKPATSQQDDPAKELGS